MKKLLPVVLFLFSLNASSQESQQHAFPHASRRPKPSLRNTDCPRVYLGVSSGINNNDGLIGGNIDLCFSGAFSLGAGVGISSWGYKVYGEGRYYFSPCNRGWALGAAIVHNTGLIGVPETLETVNPYTGQYADQDVVLDLKPVTSMALSFYRFWNLGRRYNRLFLQGGWSVPLTTAAYDERSGYPLSDKGRQSILAVSPGGLIIGFGFSFALGS